MHKASDEKESEEYKKILKLRTEIKETNQTDERKLTKTWLLEKINKMDKLPARACKTEKKMWRQIEWYWE